MTMAIREPLPTNPEGLSDRERITRVETKVERLENDIAKIASSVPNDTQKLIVTIAVPVATALLTILAAYASKHLGVDVPVPVITP